MQSTAAHRVFDVRSMMNESADPQWSRLRHQVASWQYDDRAPGTPLERYGRYLDWLETCASPPEGGLAVALAYFLPHHCPPPDSGEWQALCQVSARRTRPHPYDLAMAWAAGWRPGERAAAFAPGRIGELAVLALAEQVEAALEVSLRLLATQTGLSVVERSEIASIGGAITMSLLGVCDCGHHLRGCGRSCGRNCCYPDHDLRTWDPGSYHLRPFLDQAVRGTAQRRILGGAFAASMLFRTLEAEGRLLCRTVEWGRCDECGRTFEGARCPGPHQQSGSAVRREPRKNQIIVPASGTGPGHVPMQRWWCARCRHLYGSAGDARRGGVACPRCGSVTPFSKAVWTLAVRERDLEYA